MNDSLFSSGMYKGNFVLLLYLNIDLVELLSSIKNTLTKVKYFFNQIKELKVASKKYFLWNMFNVTVNNL